MSQTRLNAPTMTPSSFWSTSDFVHLRGRRSIGTLADDLRLDARRVLRREDAFEGARGEDVHLKLQDLLVRDRLRPGEPDHGPGLLLEREDLLRVEPLLAEDAALRVGHRDDLRPLFVVHQTGEVHADVPEALNRDGRSLEAQLR